MLRPLSIACLLATTLASNQVFALPPQEVIDAINSQHQTQAAVAPVNKAPVPPPAVVANTMPSPQNLLAGVNRTPQSPPAVANKMPPPQNLLVAANKTPQTPPTTANNPQPVTTASANDALILEEDAPPPFADPTRIVLDNKNWGGAKPADVQAVLDSTVETIMPYMDFHPFGNILIRQSKTVPVSQYEKGPHGEYIIQISASGNHWAQYVFQFSHEMCHLISNYDLAPSNTSHQQWVDESLCDAFSLFTLQQMEAQWKTKPPYPNWKDYAPNFSQYAEDELNKPHRKLPDGMKLGSWIASHQQQLSNDPIAEQRHLNEVVGKQLLSVFAAKPQSWASLNFLNLGDDRNDKSLGKFLNDWKDNVSPDMQDTIGKVQNLLLPAGQ